jgi:hypothetical protein
VAGVAAALRAERPALTPSEAGAALIGTAAPRGEQAAAGGGDPLLQAARATPVVARPAQLVLRAGGSATVRLVGLARHAALPAPSAGGLSIAPVAGKPGSFRVSAAAGSRPGAGRIDAGPVAIPFSIVSAVLPPPPLGALRIVHRGGRADGVRFVAGTIRRGSGGRGAAVVPVGNLVLTLEGPGRRELTPPGGARDLLPGEYAYTLTDEINSALPPGRYRFVVRARGTAGGKVVERRSRSFNVT